MYICTYVLSHVHVAAYVHTYIRVYTARERVIRSLGAAEPGYRRVYMPAGGEIWSLTSLARIIFGAPEFPQKTSASAPRETARESPRGGICRKSPLAGSSLHACLRNTERLRIRIRNIEIYCSFRHSLVIDAIAILVQERQNPCRKIRYLAK